MLKKGMLVRLKDGLDREPIYPFEELGVYVGPAEYGSRNHRVRPCDDPDVPSNTLTRPETFYSKPAYKVFIQGRVQIFDEPYWIVEPFKEEEN